MDAVGARRLLAFGWVLRGVIAEAQRRFDDAEAWSTMARAEFVRVGDAVLVIDCDVGHLNRLLAFGRVDDVIELAPSVQRRLGPAEIPVKVGFDRTVGHARTLTGDRSGLDQIRRALHKAKSRKLVYDEYLCLDTLLALAGQLQANEVARVQRAHAAIVAKLGIVALR